MSIECPRCARRAECGETFTPHIDWGECGHCDGCADFKSVKEAKDDNAKGDK